MHISDWMGLLVQIAAMSMRMTTQNKEQGNLLNNANQFGIIAKLVKSSVR